MIRLFGAACLMIGAAVAPANAQNCCIFTGISCQSCDLSVSTAPNCDSNKNTPVEVVDCKLKYWRGIATQREETLAKYQQSLDEARDRVRAFEAAKKP